MLRRPTDVFIALSVAKYFDGFIGDCSFKYDGAFKSLNSKFLGLSKLTAAVDDSFEFVVVGAVVNVVNDDNIFLFASLVKPLLNSSF